MSLLLDALNRASKEKQKAAAAALPPEVPVEPLQWEPVAPPPEPVVVVPEPIPTPQPSLASVPPPMSEPAVELELELELSPTATPQAAAQPVPVAWSPAAVEPPPASEPPATAAVVAPATPVVSPEPPRSAPLAAAKPVPEEQMAQDIRRAYEKQPTPSHTRRRRVMALGGLALGLALAFGSVFLGVWGDPATILGLSGQSSVAMPTMPAAPSQVIVAPTPEPTVAAVEPKNPPVVAVPAPPVAPIPVPNQASKAAQLPASAKPPRKASATAPEVAPVAAPVLAAPSSTTVPTNDVVVRGNAATKPAFVAKTRGPGALELGYVALLDGRLDEASQAYGQALRANPDERDALLGMAYINHQKGRREEAQAYYRKVLRQEPGNAVATAGLQSLESGSDSASSSSRATELAARQPDSAAAMAMAGNALVRDGLLADAAQAFARAQALEPSNPMHAYNHAVALDRLGQHAAALTQYDKVLGLSATAPAAVRAFQVDAVRLRVEQLRHALATTSPVKP